MVKHRKAYYTVEKALNCGALQIVILMGMRKMGKTTILKQLAEKHDGYYLDFKDLKDPVQDYLGIFDRKENLILLDEVGFLPDFDACLRALEHDLSGTGKKVVFTSSSYGALKQLGKESLGGGRSHKVELFPLDFEEYLFFSGRISAYGEDYEPTEQDVQDYYRLEGIHENMRLIVDRRYMEETFNDIETARDNYQHAIRDVFLTEAQHIAVIDILAYSLNEQMGVKRFGKTSVGVQEFGRKKSSGLDLSNALINYANEESKGMEGTELAQIIAYLIYAGFLFVDLTVSEGSRQNADRIVSSLLEVRGRDDLQAILEDYTLSVISPLLYTRLMIDLEGIVGEVYTMKPLSGQLYELAVKSEAVYKDSSYLSHTSYKYTTADTRVDLVMYSSTVRNGLLLEASVGYKPSDKQYIDTIFPTAAFIRVLTDEPGVFEFNDVFYRIGYPKALLMISNGSIFNLETSKVLQTGTFDSTAISANPYEKPHK